MMKEHLAYRLNQRFLECGNQRFPVLVRASDWTHRFLLTLFLHNVLVSEEAGTSIQGCKGKENRVQIVPASLGVGHPM